jgi:hypothetical protein
MNTDKEWTEIFEEMTHEDNDEYKQLREDCSSLLDLELDDFFKFYDSTVNRIFSFNLESKQTEVHIKMYLAIKSFENYKFSLDGKKNQVDFLLSEKEHYLQIATYCLSKLVRHYRSEYGNSDVIEKKIKNISGAIKNSKKDTLLIQGKKLNITERYHIANNILGIDKKIRNINISAADKHKLIAHIMSCNEQTARHLFNGTNSKRTQLREDIVNPYLERLN